MDIISKHKTSAQALFHSSQLRYAITYILITVAALCFLNVQVASNTRNMLFQAKSTAMTTKGQLIVTSLSNVEALTAEHAEQVVTLLRDDNDTRILVTDTAGMALYDSQLGNNAEGKAILFPEIQQALQGLDVFYASYDNRVLESKICLPVYFGNQMTGTVYLLEFDGDQGAIIGGLETNILRTTLILSLAVILFSILFSLKFSHRMRLILHSIQLLREGDYNHHIDLKGNDEVGVMASEFNQLTQRLQSLEKAQRQFVSDASHELKTPLASIKLLSDSILQNQMDMETTREFVEDIGNEADRLTRLAQKLLELNRGEAPRADLLVIEAGPVVERVARMLQASASAKEVAVTCNLEMGCTLVSMEDDFYQVVFNLAENAIKYNETGGTVSLNLYRDDDDVILKVVDTGMGIPEESLDHVFDRFYRVDKARSRQAGGNGLGLSIVHEMVTRNYGKVSLTSQLEEGTCFTVTFPYFGTEEELT